MTHPYEQPSLPHHATPFADAPDSLLIAWNRLALRGEVDPQHPPATVEEAYDQIVEIHVRQMRAAMQAIDEDVHALRAEQETAQERTRAACAVCGARQLEHFYTSKRNGRTLCAACFAQRVERRFAREVTLHPEE